MEEFKPFTFATLTGTKAAEWSSSTWGVVTIHTPYSKNRMNALNYLVSITFAKIGFHNA